MVSLPSFYPFVEKEWNDIKVEGRGDYVLKEKLFRLKNRIKWWNKEVFGKIELEIEEGARDINFGDDRLEVEAEDLHPEIIKGRKEATSRFWTRLRLRENMIVQKSRLRWLKEGDSNSGLFHKVMKDNRNHNHIGPINSSRGMLDSVEGIKEEVVHHFSSKFHGFDEGNARLDGISFNCISEEEKALIPKGSSPLCLDDYRPICLVGCMYKVVAKLLVGRLKHVLNSVVSHCQSAFVPGRQLLDGVLVANEAVDFARKEGGSCLLFKVDFEKAYDKVSWNFLRYLLVKMGFGAKWRKWMELLIFKSNMSVMVNGSPTKEFVVNRGLRQGDPLSPFLFVLVTEALTRLVRKSIEIGDFEAFDIKRRCEVDILQFADDTLLVGTGTWKHVKALKIVLRSFELVSGLGINFHKSKLIGINVSSLFLDAAAYYLSCRVEDNNFLFLGIPIGSNPRKEATWAPLMEKLKKKLSGWKARFLNLGGRLTLLKSILSPLFIFTMSFYKMPARVVKAITAIQSNFLWGGGGDKRIIHWVGWKGVTLPLAKGGLGIKNIAEFNLALLNKWRWRIAQGHKSLRLDVLKVRYGDLCLQIICDGDAHKPASSSFWWRDILKVSSVSSNSLDIDPIVSSCKFIVGNGFNTPFWESCWLNNCFLKEAFPDLFLASSLKKVSVAVMGEWNNGCWKWGDLGISVAGKDVVFLSSLLVLKNLLDSFGSVNSSMDCVVWLLDLEKGYSIASCYGLYASRRIPYGPPTKGDEAFNLLWKMDVPYKIKTFGWRLFLNRLPTKDLLVYRGIDIPISNLNCIFCEAHVEEVDHLFSKCFVIKLVWNEIASWVGFPGWMEEECASFFVN
ncbi:uncharacterized protein LOC131653017 [Vicia villosa]|uniref:uncharacterized protein LOC131653017 n=1 Tax=Vicia villosa TaxID=3911 RepID=UPI00273C0F60|nr:uncharacterized protein LOC131653017 [Vicia villosa]